ncbi:MAG: secretin N-terminal domain-containing protein, partial [Pirellulaceae bacterium]
MARCIQILGIAILLLFGSIAPAKAQNTPQDFDFARLAHPDIAEFLELTDVQRTEINRLIAEMAAKIAATPEPERAAVAAGYNQQIKALLNAEQVQRIDQLPELRKLKFNFGSPKWEDVLRWFAKQADLSLVMSEPPTGPFNYTDNREYTPAQAIDLLNSILLTKGYTLVRRDKLLILVEIKDGVPDEILPRVTLDELDKRGTFELVSVMFSLGGKPLDVVQAEIKPLLGSYGKVASLPNSKQLLVTETVGKIRAINLLIQSIPEVAPEAVPPKPAPAEPPVLETYSLGQLDPKATTEALKLIAPATVVTCDVASGKVVAFGPPTQLAVVKSYLEQLTSSSTPDGTIPKLQIYNLTGTVDSKQLQEQVQLVTPQAKLAFDAAANRLLVFATESQQQQVQTTLQKLQVVSSLESTSEVEVFRLKRANPATVSQMALAVSPRASVTVDAATSSVVIRAASAELALIRQLVEQLDGGTTASDALVLKSFPVTKTPPTEFMTVLQSLVPRAKIQVDATANSLFVIASAGDLATLEPLIQQYQATQTVTSSNRLVTYKLSAAQKAKFQALSQTLTTELATIKIVSEPTSTNLTVWGTPQQHEFVAGIVEQIKSEPDPTSSFSLISLDANVEGPDSLLTMLKQLHPAINVSLNTAKDKVVIWAAEEDQQLVKQSLERLRAEMPAAEKPSYEVFDLRDIDPAQAITLIQPLAPDAKMTVDAVNRRVTVLAKARDHATVRETIEKLATKQLPAKPRLGVYALNPDLRPRLNAVVAASAKELAQVKILDEQRPGELAVMATDVEHELIRQIVDQLSQPVAGAEPFVVVAYSTGEADPAQMSEFVQAVFKSAKVVPDVAGQRLLIWASATTHQEIEKSLQELSKNPQAAGDNRSILQSYRLQVTKATSVIPMLQKFLPRMQLTASDEQGLLIAWGRAADHEKLKSAVSQINIPDDPKSLAVEIYPTGNLDTQIAAALLTKMFPDAIAVPQSTASTVTVLARGDQHKLIRKTLEQLGTMVQSEGPLTVSVYRVDRSGRDSAISALQPLVPQAKLVPGAATTQLIALANAKDHKRIGELISLLETDMPDTRNLVLRTYQLRRELAAQVRPIIVAALPTLKMLGTDPNSFAVWATDAEHSRLKEMIEEAERQIVTVAKSFQSYEVQKVSLAQARAAIQAQLTTLTFIELANDKALTILASEEEHQQVTKILDDLQKAVVERPAQQVATYPVPDTSLTLLIDSLPKKLTERATIKPDTESNSLVITAEAEVHAQLADSIATLQQQLPRLDRPLAKIYPMQKLVAKDWQALIAQVAPTATTAVDAGSGTMVVTARRLVHEQIARLMDEFKNEMTGEKTIHAYRVSRADLTVASQAITALVPNSKVSADTTTKSLLVVASETDHAVVAQALDQIDRNAPNAAVSQVYPIPSGDAAALAVALKSLVPSGAFVAEATGKSILVLATNDEQATIKTTIEQWTLDPARKLSSQVYALERADPTAASTVLQRLLPGATFAVDLASRSLAVTGTAEQHRLIAETVKELDSVTQMPVSKVYPANGMPGKDWQALMSQLAPGAVVATDPATNSLVITARPQVHVMIDNLMGEFRSVLTAGKTAQAYRLTRADVTVATEALSALLPNAKVSSDKLSKSLIVVADEKDQATAAMTIDQIDRNAPNAAVSQVYPIPSGDAAALAVALKSLVPSGAFVAEATGKSILVLATTDEQATIKTTIEQWTLDPARKLSSQVYALERADPTAASTVLQRLLPGATFAVDLASRSLAVTGTADQHRLIAETVKELDSVTQMPVSKVYPANGMPGKDWQALMSQLAPGAVVATDPATNSLVITARPQVHVMIDKLMGEFRSVLTAGKTAQAYRLTRADVTVATEALSALLPNAKVSSDKLSKSLIV